MPLRSILSDEKLTELQKHYEEKAIPYWLGCARKDAKEGFVENVIYCLKRIEGCETILPATRKVLKTEKDGILDVAYRNGIERQLYFARKSIEVVERTVEKGKGKSFNQLVEETRHKDSDIELTVLCGYCSLEDARKYAKIIKANIERDANKIEEKLNSLGLQEFLSKPPF